MTSNKEKGNKLLKEIEQKPVEEQAKSFLRAFVLSLKGNFEEILRLAENFLNYRTRKAEDKGVIDVCALEEADLYRFLEAEGHPTIASVFRSEIHTLDIEKEETTRQFSFIVFALWFYKKNVSLLVPPEGTGEVDPQAIAALEEALAAYQKVVDARKEREKNIARLQELAALGGVKGLSAKNELDQIFAADQLARNKAEISAAAKRRLAQKAVDSGTDSAQARERALKQEMQKLEAEKKKKEEAERREQEEKRNKLKAKAAMFNQPPTEQAPIIKKNTNTQPAKKWGTPPTTSTPVNSNTSTQKPVENTNNNSGSSVKSAMDLFKQKDAEDKKKQEEQKDQPKKVATHQSIQKQVQPQQQQVEHTQPQHQEPQPQHQEPQQQAEQHAEEEETSNVRAKVVYEHAAGSEKEISLKLGQILTIYTQDTSGWWEAENSDGERGWIPCNFVEII